MAIPSFLKFLLSDNESLVRYSQGIFGHVDEIKRHLLLMGREQNRSIPDHYYRLEQERSFRGIISLVDVVTDGIMSLTREVLELNSNKITVLLPMQNDWQELITHIPPLLLQSAFLYEKSDKKFQEGELAVYYDSIILPNTRYTAMPSPKIPQLDHYVDDMSGLHDLHTHLNGATETDVVWQEYLKKPSSIYRDLCKAIRNPKVKEQLEQESYLFSPSKYISLLKTAQKLRNYFFDLLFSGHVEEENKYVLLNRFINDHSIQSGDYRHPFAALISDDDNYPHLLSVEALMYILLFRDIRRNKNETLAAFFHFYILILGLTNRLLVQQVHQNGFEQFQKNTLNGLRENAEKKYKRRYLQMHGNDARNIRFLEARFSPKRTRLELVRFVNDIWDGWEAMKCDIAKFKGNGKELFLHPKLKLVAHFIKEKDNDPDWRIRHKKLRYEVWQKARVLSLLLKNDPKYRGQIVAVDAAASEFDAPPEVFAPVFRLMRRSGIKHFTYHAGEDFYHILCGLRAVYEAIVFCGLERGDRIGHATSTGLSVRNWQMEVGNTILMRQGEYLDSLVFSYHLIISLKIASLHPLIPFIINRVQHLCYEIYKEHHPISVMVKAWLMRQCCPVHAFHAIRKDIELLSIYDLDEWDFLISGKFIENRGSLVGDMAWELFCAYHDKTYRKAYDEILPVDVFEIFNADEMEILQLNLLAEMNRREIVIETLPTSNVRIGFHRSYNSYHLFNWIKWRSGERSIPPIVIGTDDAGIFATNIYNEYANIYCCLLNEKRLSHSAIMDIIKRLDEDSRIYKFE